MNLYIKVLKQYGDFKNRSTFKEFWQFTLFSVLITLLFTVIDISISFKIIYNFGILSVFYSINCKCFLDNESSSFQIWLFLFNIHYCIDIFICGFEIFYFKRKIKSKNFNNFLYWLPGNFFKKYIKN